MHRVRPLTVALLLALLLVAFGWWRAPAVQAQGEGQDESAVAIITVVEGNAPAPRLRPTMSVPLLIDGKPVVASEQTEPIVIDGDAVLLAADKKWIEVDLSEQKTIAYEGLTPVREFLVSTGLPGTPTVTGVFRMWTRTPVQDMYGGSRAAGSYYYLRDVRWVQYFYEDYSFHGTYWHNNFGHPMSHGCVNMTNEDAEWLFKWAMPEWDGEQGWLPATDQNNTLVVVHE